MQFSERINPLTITGSTFFVQTSSEVRVVGSLTVAADLSVARGHEIAREVRHQLLHHLPHLGSVTLHVDPTGAAGETHHRIGEHAHDGLPLHTHH